jgi:ribosomal protein S18 acetylase RimI-like enzyme
MTLSLRALDADALARYREVAEAGYADGIEQHAGMPRVLAEAKASRDFEALWPDGVPGPDHWVYALEDSDGDGDVGYLWLSERDNQGRKVLWIYDIEIDERFRGRGHGRAAMALVEEQARERGLERVELNVFGGNAVARSLYRSLGYEESAVWMGKDLA